MRKTLTIFAVLFINNAFAYNGSQIVDGVKWYYDRISDGNGGYAASITYKDFNYNTYSGALTIPAVLGGYTVTSIGDYAFCKCNALTSITIPDTVMTISDDAFSNSSLESIEIPDSVTNIGEYAFCSCSRLIDVAIPDSVMSIGKWAFYHCSRLTNIRIPDSVVSIGTEAFSRCNELTRMTILPKVASIESSAFNNCNDLLYDTQTVAGVRLVDGWAIGHAESLSGDLDLTGIRGIGSSAFDGCSGLTRVNIPDGVMSIGDSAFWNCTSLTNIALPESVELIGSYAFSYCRSLTNIVLPKKVASIGAYAFWSCSSLEAISVPAGVTSISQSTFSGCSALNSIIIPNSVVSIGSDAFKGCTSLKSISIPNSVTSVEATSFKGCANIVSASINGSLFDKVVSTPVVTANKWRKLDVSQYRSNAIGAENSTEMSVSFSVNEGVSYSFKWKVSSEEGCDKLEYYVDGDKKGVISGKIDWTEVSLELSAGTHSIRWRYSKDFAVSSGDDCGWVDISNLESKTYVRTILPDSFAKLESLELTGAISSVGRCVLGCTSLTTLVLPTGVETIEAYAFEGCSSLNAITIPNGVTRIGQYAFKGCSSLETLVIPDSVRFIDTGALRECNMLSSVTIPENVTVIGADILYGCNELKEIVGWRPGLPTNVERIEVSPSVAEIPASTFSGCDALTSLTIPEGVIAIGNDAFYGCGNLTHISLPESIRSFGDNDMRELPVCEGAEGLCVKDGWVLGYIGTAPEVVTIPEGVVGIASHAFEGQTDIGTVHLPKSLKYIGVKAFRNCTWLQDLNLPVGLEKIDVAAFENCTSLDHLVCTEGLLEIGADAFKDCWRMLSVSLPASLGLIGSNAFSGCTSLVGATLPAHIRPVSEVLPDVYGNLTEIIIAEGSTKVCENAFVGCAALTSVVVPGSVISIDTGAFRGCEYLGSVSFKSGIVRIGAEAFKGCVRLSAVEFPDTLEEIGMGAFKECNRLTSVTFSDGLCKIDDSAFYGASGIVSLKFPQSLRSIGSKAFYGLQNLRSIEFADGLVEIGAEAFKGCSCLPAVEFPEGLETIGDSAFYGSAGISSLKFPESLRSIGANTFYGLQDLKSVEIPERVSEVGAGAFANCANIQEVSMPVGAWTVEGVFTTAYNKISSVQVVGAPTALPDGFLRNCSAIKEFEIPKTIQTIGVEAFKGTALLAINLPSGLKSIGASAFYGLTAPSVLILPEGLEVIGGSAFYGCSSITEVEIPMGVERLEVSTFAMCAKLVKVALPASLTSINGSAFSNDAAIRSVSIPGNLGTLKTIFPNAYDKISEVTIDESSSGLCESFMDGCKSVLAVGVPAGVKTIGKNAFRNCAALESFALPTGVTTISEGIFSGCTRLSSIVFPSEVISLGANIFNGCTALASVYFLGSAPNVDVNVYSGTPTTLTTYVVKGSVEWDGIPNSKALPKAWPTTNGRTITYWEPNVFDVTFFGNGGTPESQVVSETTGTTYIMPQENPSRVGATFAGWWTEPVNGGQVKGTMRVDLTRPHSFYAHWRFNRYTVRFEPNGADGEMPTLAMTVDEPMNLPPSGFVRIDHEFVGWALEPEGEVAFTDGAEVINLSMEDGETVRLYAVWAEREWSAADYLGAKGLVFTSDGDAVWFPDAGTSHDGIGSMRSGEIGIADAGETTRSTLKTTVAGNGTLTFWWKLNCEGPDPDYGDLYDYLEFTIDGVRPTAVEPIAGDVDWMEVEVRIEGAMPTHELAWSFVKDDWDEEALPDVAWVDELIWTPDTVAVSFDGNGATDGDVPSAMALVAGAELVLPEAGTLHKRTCKFGGWTDGSKTYAAGETYIVGAADVMFSAVWIEFTIADALNASGLVFTTGGDAVWTADFETSHDGEASVRSGVVGTSQESWIETKVDGAGTLTFVWKADGFVYRNNPANYVQYVVDGGETVKVAVCDWTEVEIEVTGAGEHTVRWSYSHTRSQASGGDCAWLDEVRWVAAEVPLSPTIEGDEEATVTGDAETGFVIKPSEGKTVVEVTIPQGVDAAKVTVEVSTRVESVKSNGAKVKIISGGADITKYLDIPGTTRGDDGGVVATQPEGVVDLTKATVKEEIVKEAMDPEKGAVIDLSGGSLGTTSPTITTAPTRVGLFYTFSEGRTLDGMERSAGKPGDGKTWSPEIKIKGGNSAFYSIGVGKGE